MRKSNLVVAEILALLKENIKPGVSTFDLEEIAQREVDKRGVKPAFKGYHGFPCCLCTSVNEEVVHGIPSKKKILKEGDILGIDFGVNVDGFFGDSAFTAAVGKISENKEKLMKVTEETLYRAIEQCQVGNRLSDLGYAVQTHAEDNGFSVVRAFVGHGIGRGLHEAPQVPNYGRQGRGIKLEEGLVIAIEPMINEGTEDIRVKEDGWTAVTADNKMSAHFEHTVAITKDGPYILSKI